MPTKNIGANDLKKPLPSVGEECLWDAQVHGLVLRRRPTRQSWALVTRNPSGKRIRVTLGDAAAISPTQARELARQHLYSISSGFDPAEKKREARREAMTLGSYLDEHYEPWALKRLNTARERLVTIRKHFAFLLDKPMSKITAKEVTGWQTRKIDQGHRVAANRYCTYLKAIFSRAIEDQVISENPISPVKPIRANERAKVRYLADDERARLMDAIEEREQERRDQRGRYNQWLVARHQEPLADLDTVPFTDMMKPAVLVALHTGTRRSEQFGIRWKHVDFERNAIDLPKEICKSKKPRTIPMTPRVRDTLAAWKEQTGGAPGDLVFANADGKEINIKKGFAALLERARIEDFTWHSMRHDFASQLVMKGVDVFVVSKLLGHADVQTTIAHYAHLSPRIQANAIAVLEPKPAENVIDLEAARKAQGTA